MSAQTSDSQGWQVRLFGKFRLIDPAGNLIRLPDRKTEGLFAMLVLNRAYGIERQTAADNLWPKLDSQNLTNLRQALSVIRRTLGPNAIDGSVNHCRFETAFLITSDYECPDHREDAGFMPGHDGEWFEDIRLEVLEVEAEEPKEATVVDSFLQMLQWFSTHDPVGMYALLSASPPLARGIPYSSLLAVLEATKHDESCRGWYSYWRGTAEDDLELCARHLRFAFKEAKRTNNLVLASEVCYELGRVYSRTGRLERAMNLCNVEDEIAARLCSPTSKRNAIRLRGSVQLNWHDHDAALVLMRILEDQLDNPIELYAAQAARAFHEASVGQFENAELTLSKATADSGQIGHFRIDTVSAMTQSLLRVARGSRPDGVKEMDTLARKLYGIGATQFGVYAEELIAKLHLINGDRGESERRMQSARDARLISQMVVTPLEAKRVSVVR